MADLSVYLAKTIFSMTLKFTNLKLLGAVIVFAMASLVLVAPHNYAHADNDDYGDYSASQLRDLINDLKDRLKNLQGGSIEERAQDSSFQVFKGNSFGQGSIFKAFTRNFERGSRDRSENGEVSRLQWCLSKTGDYDYDEITGYYGEVTERAVQKFQSRFNIVSSGNAISTGFGRVGPRTLTFINKYCQGIGDEVDELVMDVKVAGNKATVVAAIPHPVITDDSCEDLEIGTIDWGDGETTDIERERCPISTYRHTATHTYDEAGTYTVELTSHDNSKVSEEITIEEDDDDDKDEVRSFRWWYDKNAGDWRWGVRGGDDEDEEDSDEDESEDDNDGDGSEDDDSDEEGNDDEDNEAGTDGEDGDDGPVFDGQSKSWWYNRSAGDWQWGFAPVSNNSDGSGSFGGFNLKSVRGASTDSPPVTLTDLFDAIEGYAEILESQ